MKTLMMSTVFASIFAFAACDSTAEACYKCEGYLGLETECCGDKEKCETFKKDCTLNGGKMILKGDKDK